MRPLLDRLRAILGHLADVERRIQSQVPVSADEMARSAGEVEELKELGQQMGPSSAPWDIFYRKYSALLHNHLKAAGLRASAPTPKPWDAEAGLKEVTVYFERTVGPTATLATLGVGGGPERAALQLTRLARHLAELGEQQDRLEKQAQVCLDQGDRHAAVRRLGEALDLFDRRRTLVGDEQQQIFFNKEGIHLWRRLVQTNLELGDRSGALEAIERMKARSLLSIIGLAPLRRPLGYSELARREEALLAEARQIVPTVWSSAAQESGERGFELWGRAAELRRELESIWTEMAGEPAWGGYVAARRGDAPGVEGIRACLRAPASRRPSETVARAAYLSYFVDEGTTWAFLLHPDRQEPIAEDTGVAGDHLLACAQRLVLDCNGIDPEWHGPEQEALDRALSLPPAVRRASRQWPRDNGPNPRSLGGPGYRLTYLNELSDKLLPGPVRAALEDREVLCISPHGPLHGLPLHALRWDSGTFVCERFGICYVPSAGVLRHCQDRNRMRSDPHRPRTGLAACVDMLGNQSFEGDGDLLERVAKNEILTGAAKATKAAFVNKLGSAEIIHLACHGLFAEDYGWKTPLESGILLGDGQRPRVDATQLKAHPDKFRECLLTAREILGLALNADLVTLRACSSGRGAPAGRGDDILGLSRAWLHAGAPSLLMSMWNVNNVSSHRLLRTFYEQWLTACEPKWKALQAAQQAALRDPGNGPHGHPYHWAAFELIGDWE
jgi:CHAT domain-containing protein